MKLVGKLCIYSTLFFSISAGYGFEAPSWMKSFVHACKTGKDYIEVHDKGKEALESLANAQAQSNASIEIAKAGAQVATAASAVSHGITTASVTTEAVNQTTAMTQQVNSLRQATEALQQATTSIERGGTVAGSLDTLNTTATKIQEGVEAEAKHLSTLEKLAKIFAPIAAAASTVVIIEKLYRFKCYVGSKICPSDEEQNKTIEAKQRLRYLKAKERLDDSLVAHARMQRDEDGIPYLCRDAAEEFAKAAGPGELKKVLKEFNEVFGRAATC